MRVVNRDVTKLPKWAQTEIEVLTRRVGEFEQREQDRVNGDSARTFSIVHLGFNPYRRPVPLQSDEIEFRLGEDAANGQQSVSVHVLLDNNDNVYELRVQGDRRIKVLPQATNAVYLRLDD